MTKEWRQDAGKRIEQATSVKELDDILYDLNELEPGPRQPRGYKTQTLAC